MFRGMTMTSTPVTSLVVLAPVLLLAALPSSVQPATSSSAAAAARASTCFVTQKTSLSYSLRNANYHGRLGGGPSFPSSSPSDHPSDVVALLGPLPLIPSRRMKSSQAGCGLRLWGGIHGMPPSSTPLRRWFDVSSTLTSTSIMGVHGGARRGERRKRRRGGDGGDGYGHGVGEDDPLASIDDHDLTRVDMAGAEDERGDGGRGRHFYSRKSLSDRSLLSPATDTDVEERRVFRKLCEAADVVRPSRVQALAWPVLLDDDGGRAGHAIVADQTGSGKTLAYLIPLLLRMLVEERKDAKDGIDDSTGGRPTNAPRILILAPTTELAHQLYGVCRRIGGRGIPFRTEVATSVPPPSKKKLGVTEEQEEDDEGRVGAGGRSSSSPERQRGSNNNNNSAYVRDQIRRLKDPGMSPVDVLVATPGRVASLVRGGVLDLTHLQSLVLDEVDVLMIDETFGPQLRTVGASAPLSTRFVFVTATLPDSIVDDVRREFPDVVTVKGPGLHRVAPTLREYLVDVSVDNRIGGTSNRDAKACFDVKAGELLKALRRTKCERTLVFCNTVESCRSVENFLKRKDRRGVSYRVGSYHGAMSPEARTRELALFSRGGTARGGGDGGGARRRRRGGGGRGQAAAATATAKAEDRVDRVLVCTDRAARGVDFGGAPVDHVVVFDFPSDPAEYVRRVGRTARAGRDGTSTVFAYGWQLPIARRIMGSKLRGLTAGTPGTDDSAIGGGPFRDGRREEVDEDVEDDAFYSSRTRRRRREISGDAISDNIASGKLWKERKPR